jgi:cytidylate kinase
MSTAGAGVGRVIAIDGPAGAGKSTVSRGLARRLGLERLDTGAMYRAVAWAALRHGIDPSDAEAVGTVAESVSVSVEAGSRVMADGVDVTEAIRSPEVNRAVSVVAANPRVRRAMVDLQRRWVAERGGGVVEGRDIGSVVFPDADLKIYLTASPEERARRRKDEGPDSVARRDLIDSTRATSPLEVADGARIVDTTGQAIDAVIEEVLAWL